MQTSEKYFLSIAIPTYKRPQLLKKCLASILAQADAEKIGIWIYDDSVDNTNESVYEWMRTAHSGVNIVRNQENLGIDHNIEKAVTCTDSRYVWLLGEDDLLAPNVLSDVLEVLERGSFEFYFCNYSYVSNDYSRIIRDKRLEFNADFIIAGSKFYEENLWSIGFIGACIVRRQSWLSKDHKRYLGTFFNHVGVISEIIFESSVYMFAKPLVLNRAEDVSSTSWSSSAFAVNFGWDKMLEMTESVVGHEARIKAQDSSKEIFWHRSMMFLLSKRADGIYDRSIWRDFILSAEFSNTFKLSAWAVSFIPSGLLRGAKRSLKKMRSVLRG